MHSNPLGYLAEFVSVQHVINARFHPWNANY
jgi:hypothetical protein